MTSPDQTVRRPELLAGDVVPRLDFLPWEYAGRATEAERKQQAERHRGLAATGEVELAADAFVASTAA
ncbi:MAG: hypothetical protein QOG10_2610, partial [Kribbellaceae bacterium]|nr:hypothetical protein [Kribbellaceae bacterium]